MEFTLSTNTGDPELCERKEVSAVKGVGGGAAKGEGPGAQSVVITIGI